MAAFGCFGYDCMCIVRGVSLRNGGVVGLVLAADDAFQGLLGDARVRLASVVPQKHLCRDFDLGVLGHHLWRDLDALVDADARLDDGVVLHVRHGDEAVDALDAQPVQHVGHQSLEPRVCDASDGLRAIEVLRGAITALLSFAHVVDQVFRHLAQSPALLAEVDDDSISAALRALDALFDGVRQVRAARANVAPEDVAAVALVVHAASQLHRFIR
mmetsp:Transcript_3601/g.10927  ORF Transcript_3601/g.10927 Transcript_3601/m.10927 type:complete len:215 (-) Transcript_3601:2485-3129(-)